MQLNGSQIFVEVLCEQGVDTLFGYPGGAVLNLYDELYKNADRITHVLTAHEQGAAHAADGYARATGRTGVVLATSGPGATNLVTGIATAYMDSVPMVAFTGNVPTSSIGKDGFQEAYIEGITVPITKHNFTVRRVEDLADTMRAAFRIAQSGRKGHEGMALRRGAVDVFVIVVAQCLVRRGLGRLGNGEGHVRFQCQQPPVQIGKGDDLLRREEAAVLLIQPVLFEPAHVIFAAARRLIQRPQRERGLLLRL